MVVLTRGILLSAVMVGERADFNERKRSVALWMTVRYSRKS